MRTIRPSRLSRSLIAIATAATLVPLGLLAISPGAGASSDTVSERAFHDDMRKLWEDHVTWTRLFIVSFAADLPDLEATTNRLLQNQTDIGDAVKPFYGDAAGNELTDLLRTHILIAADVLAAADAGDTPGFENALDAWYANGNDVARFLHRANPANWQAREMRSMMREHLDLTLAEAAHRLAGEFERDIAAYEDVHVAILQMADMLSSGIVAQFPERFS